VVKELKPMLGVDTPVTGAPWLMTGLALLLGRTELAARLPAAGNVAISNVPGPPMTLYMAGARMLHYYPVSIPYHGMGLNITVQSYAGSLEFGLTACRRVLSQEESYELVEHLKAALKEIEALPSIDQAALAPASSAPGRVASADATAAIEVARKVRPRTSVRATKTAAAQRRRRPQPATGARSLRKEPAK
jgi:hypothetical protein